MVQTRVTIIVAIICARFHDHREAMLARRLPEPILLPRLLPTTAPSNTDIVKYPDSDPGLGMFMNMPPIPVLTFCPYQHRTVLKLVLPVQFYRHCRCSAVVL